MFEPHEDRREQTAVKSGRGLAILGFVIGAGIGWLIWYLAVLPRLEGSPSEENPSGGPSEWIYYGSLVLCLVIALFVVAVLGEWIGKRRRKGEQ